MDVLIRRKYYVQVEITEIILIIYEDSSIEVALPYGWDLKLGNEPWCGGLELIKKYSFIESGDGEDFTSVIRSLGAPWEICNGAV